MKKIKFLVMAVIVFSLAACSGGGKLSPASKKVNGPLGKFFEVVERDYKFNDDELSVEFKRIAEGGPTDASWSSRPTFTLELLDGDGDVISSVSTDVVITKEQLEAVFALGIDETTSISFKVDEAKNAEKFKISSKWDGTKEGDSESSASTGTDGVFDLHGAVDKYPITMHLEIDGTTVKGVYYYDKQGSDAELKLSGTNEDGVLDINETDSDGTPTGHFKGKFLDGTFKGTFITNQGKKMPFHVSEGGSSSNDDFSFDDNDMSMESDDFTTGEGDASIDEFINEYEKFWRKYMSFIKKANKNDPSAMMDYANLINELNEYNQKLQKMKGKMSMDQLNRLNKMNLEMMSEMQ